MRIKRLLALTSTRGRSGKDTLIEELIKQGFTVHRVAMGDALKEQCTDELTEVTGFTRKELLEFFHSDLKDEPMEALALKNLKAATDYVGWLYSDDSFDDSEPRTPRWHLQQYGTGYRRLFLNDLNVWLNAGLDKIHAAPEVDVIVVTDMRQRNEYVALLNLCEQGFMARTVRLQRMWHVPGVDDAPYHITDLDLIGYDMNAVVLNEWGQQAHMVTQLQEQGVL